jgi:rod shape-determining protein MreC
MREKRYSRFVLVFVLFIGLFLSNTYIAHNWIYNAFTGISSPIRWIETKAIRIQTVLHVIKNIQSIAQENEQLRQENNTLHGQIGTIQTLQQQNDQLLAASHFINKRPSKLIVGKIFDIQRSSTSSSLLIDIGSAEGIEKSMAVIASGNILLGVIADIYTHSSRVELLDSPTLSVNVRVTETGTLASVHGNGTNQLGTATVDLITNKDVIQEGNTLITSGLDTLPEGLYVGKISEAKLTGGNLFQYVRANLAFDPITRPEIFVFAHE